jgi:hypothetical protein
MTVNEGSAKRGDQAQLSCCNKPDYGGDTVTIGPGLSHILSSAGLRWQLLSRFTSYLHGKGNGVISTGFDWYTVRPLSASYTT